MCLVFLNEYAKVEHASSVLWRPCRDKRVYSSVGSCLVAYRRVSARGLCRLWNCLDAASLYTGPKGSPSNLPVLLPRALAGTRRKCSRFSRSQKRSRYALTCCQTICTLLLTGDVIHASVQFTTPFGRVMCWRAIDQNQDRFVASVPSCFCKWQIIGHCGKEKKRNLTSWEKPQIYVLCWRPLTKWGVKDQADLWACLNMETDSSTCPPLIYFPQQIASNVVLSVLSHRSVLGLFKQQNEVDESSLLQNISRTAIPSSLVTA